MFIFRTNRPHVDEIIKHVSAITEITLIIGLSAVTVGNFLGGVWANESWGRYWGWDPKETWAYVSIVVYAIVIHLRFIKSFNNPFVLGTAALLAFSSILMTYLGVNFYLSGMHSYATGDPVPIPTWAYITFSIVIITILLAVKNRNLKETL
jgi:ABC-type transport system involved in cytochrome c biogenesis permease subunit